jgi:acetyl-CoA carboxylase biotin carboxyl carrier protein
VAEYAGRSQLNLEELKSLLQILEQQDVVEFELEEAGTKLRIRKGGASDNHAAAPLSAATTPPAQRATDAPLPGPRPQPARPAAAEEAGLVLVKSPIVGTFYRSPDPAAAPFVNVGDNIAVGQKLCIIEAMKLMNEIEAEVAGEVVRIHPENGQPVQYGEALFSIRPPH